MNKIGIVLLIFNIPGLAGCAGGFAIEEAVPQAALADTDAPLPPPERPGTETAEIGEAVMRPETEVETAAIPAPDPVLSGTGRASATGTYPNINEEPRGAIRQLSDAERDALLVEMQALAAAHSRGSVSTAEYERRLALLRRLAATHSAETIKSIEE